MTTTEPLLITVSQAAEHLGVSSATAYRWIRAGELPAIKLNGRWRVPVSRLDLWSAAQDTDSDYINRAELAAYEQEHEGVDTP